MLNKLKLFQPTTIQETSRALSEYGEKAKVYAGGAELLLLLRNGLLDAEVLVDVKKIARLHEIRLEDGILHVGSCATHRALENDSFVRAHAPALAYAESQVANVRVRHQGTLGGNLAFNDPHSDPGTVLLIHEASVLIANKQSERRMALSEFLVDMYATALAPDELLSEIEIPGLPSGMTSTYQRLHRFQRPTLGVSVGARLSNGALEEVRLAVGCIGPKAQRLTDMEAKLRGAKRREAKRIVREEKTYLRDLLRPVDDLLGSAEYKLYMTGVMLADALERASETNDIAH